MRVKLGCLFIAFITGLFSFCYGQSSSSVRGNVFIQNKIAAEAATVILLNQPDSSVAMSALVNNKGTFEFINVTPGNYVLLATRLGYKKSYTGNLSVAAGQNLTVNTIELEPLSTELKEVSIISKKAFIEVKPGKTTINPGASIAADGKNALDILRQSPGVRVDNNDDVSISGRQSALILIDGKTTNLTGSDLADLLRSMQGGSIDKIELISGASAKYDASAGGIVNIIIKKGKNIGFNGTYSASAGMGRYHKLNTGISFNNRTAHTNFFGSYSIANAKNYADIFTSRNITDAGLLSNYNSKYHSIQMNTTHSFRVGADYFLSASQTIGFIISGLVNDNDFVKNNSLKISNKGVLDSTILARTTINRDLNSFNYNINYSNKLDKAGKVISANLTYTNSPRHSDEYIDNRFYTTAGAPYRNPLLLQNISPSARFNWTGKIDYTNPFKNGAKLEAGLKYSTSRSDNDLVFGPMVNGVYLSDTAFSNRFIYDEKVSSAYINYSVTIKKFDLEAGLRGEHTTTLGNSINLYNASHKTSANYFNLFPSATLTYHKNDKNDFSLIFSRGLERPVYESLNPFLTFLDVYSYLSGNPYLKPEYSNKVSVAYTYNQSLGIALYGNFTTQGSFPFFIQNDVTKVNTQSKVNLGVVNAYGVVIDLPVELTSWWDNKFSIDASHQQYKAYPQYGTLNQNVIDVIFKSWHNFKVSKTIYASIISNYETPTWYGVNRLKASYSFDTEIGKQILNKKGKLSFNIRDILNTVRDRYTNTYQNVNLMQTYKYESRSQVFRLNFSYNFGKSSVKSAAKHDTGNEDEQTRMRATGN
jgi:iron complex outermembrane receptor protein